MKKKHPYELRKQIRSKLPWFLIDLGIAGKGKNCEKLNADHDHVSEQLKRTEITPAKKCS